MILLVFGKQHFPTPVCLLISSPKPPKKFSEPHFWYLSFRNHVFPFYKMIKSEKELIVDYLCVSFVCNGICSLGLRKHWQEEKEPWKLTCHKQRSINEFGEMDRWRERGGWGLAEIDRSNKLLKAKLFGRYFINE